MPYAEPHHIILCLLLATQHQKKMIQAFQQHQIAAGNTTTMDPSEKV